MYLRRRGLTSTPAAATSVRLAMTTCARLGQPHPASRVAAGQQLYRALRKNADDVLANTVRVELARRATVTADGLNPAYERSGIGDVSRRTGTRIVWTPFHCEAVTA